MPITQIKRVTALLRDAEYVEGLREADQMQFTAVGMGRTLGVAPESIHATLRKLRGKREAHVHTWIGDAIPSGVWVLGKGEDALRPVVTAEDIRAYQREYYQRKRSKETGSATPDGHSAGRYIARTLATIERARVAPRSWCDSLTDPLEE